MSSRRAWLAGALLTTWSALVPRRGSAAAASRVVVVGGGFAGASCARALRRADQTIAVSLVEPRKTYTACPLSNLVIAGQRTLTQQRFGYAALATDGIEVVHETVTEVDAAARHLTLSNGKTLTYDRLIMAPGIDLDWHALPGAYCASDSWR